MAKEKQTIKRLTFTEDEAEQALLTAAEARVEAGEFAAFTDVCKAALQAFLAPVAPPKAPIVAETSSMAKLEEMVATVQATQQAMSQLLQQIATQSAPVASSREEESTTLMLERLAHLAQAVAEVQAHQRTLQESVQQSHEQMTPTAELAMLAEGLTALHSAHELLQAEVQRLGESLTTALRQLSTAPTPVNGAPKPLATTAEPTTATDQTVSQATVNRLARFLEDF